MGEKDFYNDLWKKEEEESIGIPVVSKRDYFHKYIIDKLFDPFANNRQAIAARNLEKGKRILDLGTWGGEFLSRSDVKSLFVEFYGVDLPLPSIRKAKEKGIDAFQWNLNVTPYPFASSCFDCIAALAVIEHLFDPVATIREINRLLRIGGKVIVALPNVVSFSNRVRSICGFPPVTYLDPGWDGGHLHYFTIPTTRKLLEQNGFLVKGVHVTGSGQWLRKLRPTILAGEFLLIGRKIAKL